MPSNTHREYDSNNPHHELASNHPWFQITHLDDGEELSALNFSLGFKFGWRF